METMTVEQAVEESKGLTFEKVWEALMESRMQMSKLESTVSNLAQNIGGINNDLGQMAEALFSGTLWNKFDAYGYGFTKQAVNVKFVMDKKIITEVDILLEDGEYIMPVEVKAKPRIEFVDWHLERMEKIRKYMDMRGDKRKIVGAVAGCIIDKNIFNYVHEKGLYLFIQTGDLAAVADPPEGFRAREW